MEERQTERFVCPKNSVTFFPFYKTFTNWITMPYECRQVPNHTIPIYAKKKETHTMYDLLRGNRNSKLIIILCIVMTVLSTIAFVIWIFDFVYDGYIKGGVKLSEQRLQHIFEATIIKSVISPFMPV